MPASDTTQRNDSRRTAAILTRPVRVGAGALLLAIIALAQYQADPTYHVSILYLVPVFILAWFDGRALGLFAAVASGAAHIVVDVAQSNPEQWVVAWMDSMIHVGISIVGVLALAGFRDSEQRLQQALERERERSSHDPLTKLLNSQAFTENLRAEVERTRRYGGHVSLLYLDLDDFKHVNDSRGHLAGDEVIGTVGEIIRSTVRQTDVAGRMGGDEFVVLMPNTDAEVAGPAANRLHEAVENALKSSCGVTASVGVVSCEVVPSTAESLISQADQVMYDAKRQGKARVVHVTR